MFGEKDKYIDPLSPRTGQIKVIICIVGVHPSYFVEKWISYYGDSVHAKRAAVECVAEAGVWNDDIYHPPHMIDRIVMTNEVKNGGN